MENPRKRVHTGENIGTLVPVSIGESPGESLSEECFAVTATALSNALILKSIFSNLDNQDLDTCCQVSKLWNTLADPLLVRHYDVKLVEPCRPFYVDLNPNPRDYSCFITKRPTYNTDQVCYTSYSLKATIELLEQAIRREKVGIYLSIPRHVASETLAAFLSRFGFFVEKLGVPQSFTITKFVQFLHRYFPNLKHLDLTETGFAKDDEFDDNPPQTPFPQLRRIDVGNTCQTAGSSSLATLFRLAPNLEEIHDLPTCLMNAAVVTGKVDCVKSLTCARYRDETFLPAIEKLAQVDPKLHSFSFEYLQPWSEDIVRNTVTQVGPFVRRILQSSHDSLKTLALCKSESFDFNAIPPMTSVKELQFFMQQTESRSTKFFAPELNLQNLFPNVSTVNLFTRLARFRIKDITTWFPKSQFVPWGSQIEKLVLIDVSGDLLRQLSRLFPSVKDLEFCIWDGTNEIKVLLAAIAECWPEVQRITAIVTYATYPCCEVADGEACSFDSAFIGIPDEVLANLRDPVSRKEHFSPEEINKFMEESTIRKLSKLKSLVFQMERGLDSKFLEKLAAISPVSKEFGFQFLPELKIVVRMLRSNIFYTDVDGMGPRYSGCINVLDYFYWSVVYNDVPIYLYAVSSVKASLEPIVNLEIEVVP